MSRGILVLVLLAGAAFGTSAPVGVRRLANQERCPQEHREWVAQALQKMQAIQPGMTRKDLLVVFTTEGGLARDCGARMSARNVLILRSPSSSRQLVDRTVTRKGA